MLIGGYGCDSKSPTSPSTPAGGGSTNPPSTNNPAPSSTIGYVAGTVSETFPTASTAIQDVRVEVIGGTNAGKGVWTSPNGQYTLADLTFAALTLRFSKTGYQSRDVTMNFTATGTMQNTNLNPAPTIITEIQTGEISGGDSSTCGSSEPLPCHVYTVNVHNAGPLEAKLTWSGGADLDLELYRNDTRIANSSEAGGTEELVSSTVSAGSYQLRVIYYLGSTITKYTLRIARPN
jgi:hypothetical protein